MLNRKNEILIYEYKVRTDDYFFPVKDQCQCSGAFVSN